MLLLLSADFFKINFSKKKISGTLLVCQTDWIRTDVLLYLIWAKTVSKGYQQTTKAAASKEKVKLGKLIVSSNMLGMVQCTNQGVTG